MSNLATAAKLGWSKEIDPQAAELLRQFGLDEVIAGDDLEVGSEPVWIVEGVLAVDELGVIAGREKTLKTSIAIDLAVAVTTGKRFLGHFEVERTGPVLFVSAETSRTLFNQTLYRVLTARGLTACPPTLRRIFRALPLGHPDSYLVMKELLTRHEPLLVIIDTWTACRDKGGQPVNSADLAATNPICQRLLAACRDRGCTPIVLDHLSKSTRCGPGKRPLQLSDIPYTGLAHASGQWLILRRRAEYANDGRHELIVNVGGRAGHASYWTVHVDEGLVNGRQVTKWDVRVKSLQGKTENAAPAKSRRTKLSTPQRSVLKAVRAAEADPDGWRLRSAVQEQTTYKGGRLTSVLGELEAAGVVEVDRTARSYRIRLRSGTSGTPHT
jgi:hypothetical protein